MSRKSVPRSKYNFLFLQVSLKDEELMQAVRKAATRAVLDIIKGIAADDRMRGRPLMVIYENLDEQILDLGFLTERLTELHRDIVVLCHSVISFAEGGDHYRILASRLKGWEKGEWFFNLKAKLAN